MAFAPRKIFPIDTTPNTAVGVALPFNGNVAFKSTYTTKEAIKYNLINFFLTNPTERYLNPSFGGGLRSFIFEQITSGNIDFLKEDIQTKISRYFPNVIVVSLNIFQNTDNNAITISLVYNIQDTGISDNIEIQFN